MTTQLPYLICSILSFVPAIVLHEMAHGFAAWKLGDPTAKRAGRLSFNPLAHIDPFGTVIMPFLLMAMNMPVFGYAKPVPYNPAYFKDPRKGDLIVGLAGPAANLLLAVLAACGRVGALRVRPRCAVGGAKPGVLLFLPDVPAHVRADQPVPYVLQPAAHPAARWQLHLRVLHAREVAA